MTVVLVALAGAVGAPARFTLERVTARMTRERLPWGTGIVNVTGSFALGIVSGLAMRHGLSPTATATAGSGFLGAYTTFSTFALETIRLGRNRLGAGDAGTGHPGIGRLRLAAAYVGASVLLGVGAAAAGLAATGAL